MNRIVCLETKRYLAAFAAVLAATVAFGVDRVWVGPDSGGLWNSADNWDPYGKMTKEDTAIFRPKGTLSLNVTYDGSYNYAGGMRFESGTTFIGHDPYVAENSYLGYIRLKSASTVFTNEFYVAAGASCVISNACIAHDARKSAILRTGGGSMTLKGQKWGDDNGKFARVTFHEGETTFKCNGTSQMQAPIDIHAGAVVHSPCNYAFHSSETPFDIAAGGILDLEGSDGIYMAGFRGAGVLTNVTKISSMTLNGGPYRFSGHIYPAPGKALAEIGFDKRASGLAEADWKILMAETNVFSQCYVYLPDCDGSPLGFAAGVGVFNISKLQGENSSMLNLADENGNAVELRSNFTNPAKFRMKGPGSYFNDRSQPAIYRQGSTDISGMTGELGARSAANSYDITIGQNTLATWPVMDTNLALRSVYPAYVFLRGPTDGRIVLTNRVIGTGLNGLYGNLTLLHAETTGAWWQLRDNADIIVSGCSSTIGWYGLYLYAGSKLTLTESAMLSGVDAVPLYSYAGSVLKRRDRLSIGNGRAIGAIVIENGGLLAVDISAATTTVRNGGILEVYSEISDNAGQTVFDGGILRLVPSRSGFNLYVTRDDDAKKLSVGANGMTIDCTPWSGVYSEGSNQFYFRGKITSWNGEADGGIVRTGAGLCFFHYPLDIVGPFANLDGTIIIPNQTAITSATAPLFGSGDFRLGNGRIDFSGYISKAFTSRFGTGGKFLYEGAATIRVRESSSRPVQTLALGELKRNATGGALYFWDNSGKTFNSSGTTVTLTKAPTLTADGRIDQPVFTYANDTLDFTAYSAENGLKSFENYTVGFDGETAGKTVRTADTATQTHLASDTSVGALRVDGIKSVYSYPDGGESVLWIDDGATLTVGSGTSPACVILNNSHDNWSPATIRGAGTLSFGAREGVIAANNKVDAFYAAIYSKIGGTGGVTFTRAATLGGTQGVELYGTNDYTGGTLVYGTCVVPRNPQALSTGVVTLGNGKLQGGTLRMDEAGLVLPNAIRAGGWGCYSDVTSAAVVFTKDSTLSGSFEATDDVRLAAASGVRGTLSGVVSGDHIRIWKGAGEIAFTAANVCTGGVEVLQSTLVLKDAGTAGTGDITLDNGTLAVESAAAKTVPNRIHGVGKVRIAGRGAVTFANLDSQDGVGFTLDLVNRVSTVNSLAGISAITTSRAGETALVVADGDITSFAGTKPENVTLYRPGEYKPRGFVLFVK